MAELTEPSEDAAISACCAPEQQTDCCEPSEKAGCCSSDSASCGCPAGQSEGDEIREAAGLYDCAGSAIVRARKPAGES